jgi:hypothetical protein
MLLGLLRAKEMEDSINGTVRLVISNPPERRWCRWEADARRGVLTMLFLMQHAFGMHVWPTAEYEYLI